MNKFITAAFVALLSIATVSPITPALALEDHVVMVPSDDKAMAKAISRARETIDVYWAAANDPKGRKGFAVKVKISDKNGSEHFWLRAVKRTNTGFEGIIANTPVMVKKVKEGQLYAFKKPEISDWMFFENGKIIGGFTIRVMADRMPKDQAAQIKAALAYRPK